MQPYRPTIVEYRLPAAIAGGKPAWVTRTADGDRVRKSTPGAVAIRRKSPTWWGKWRRGGHWLIKPVALAGKLEIARRVLAEKVRAVELGLVGLTEEKGRELCRPLTDHLEDYRRNLSGLNRTTGHVKKTLAQACAVAEGCRFLTATDLSGQAVIAWLHARRLAGASVETSNHYLQSIRQFTNWLRRRTGNDPLADLKALNPDLDRRRRRRILPQADVPRLLAAPALSGIHHGLDADQRRLLYHTALRTGLRASELASLTPRSLSFGDSAAVTVAAASSKHRREDRLPLRRDLAEKLEWYCRGLNLGDPLWPGSWPARAAAMLRKDLERAGIPYRDDAGEVIDFHALRNAFGAHLSEAGVHPKDIQVLMRHSTITLTMDRYVKRKVMDLGEALEKLG